MPRLLLHAGFHKTGTSAIQQCAAKNRKGLLKQGILYPDCRPVVVRPVVAHHAVAHAVAGKKGHLSLDAVCNLIARWQEQACDHDLCVLLSAEAVCRHVIREKGVGRSAGRHTYLRRLREVLAGFDIEPVLVLRRQDDFMRSLYQEHVSKGGIPSCKLTFAEFRDEVGRDRVQFLHSLRMFSKVFGPVQTMVYEDLVHEGLLSAFFARLGITGLKTRNERIVRSSLSVGETLIKQRINHCIETDQQNERLLRWLGSWRVRREMRNWFDGSESLWAGRTEQADFLAQFAEENELICREFFDCRELLFPAESVHAENEATFPDEACIDGALRALIRVSPRRLRSIIGERSVAALTQ